MPVFGAERGIRAFSGAPRSAIINGVLCRKHTICGKAFCSRKTALLAQARLSLRSVTLTPTYRRSLISSLQGVINALLNGQLVPQFLSNSRYYTKQKNTHKGCSFVWCGRQEL
ncbi:MAG: hypothetical protein IJV80_03875, partial [Clostridia bacterium]|nr:hypothetical protein [Clostridia bacterium]